MNSICTRHLLRFFVVLISLISFTFFSQGQPLLHPGNDQQEPKLYEATIRRNLMPEQSSIKVLGYLGKDTWLISAINLRDTFNWVANLNSYSAEKKYHEEILQWAERKGTLYRLRVKTFFTTKTEFYKKIIQVGIEAAPFQILDNAGIFEVWVRDEKELKRLAAEDWVYFIGAVTADHTLNQDALAMTHAKSVKLPTSLGGAGLSGKGVVVGIGDDGKNDHADIDSRIVQHFNPAIGSGHSVHVGLTAAGAGIIDERYVGFAPESEIISHFFNAVVIYGPTMYQDFGMTLTNNSYGSQQGNCTFAGSYTEISAYLDEMAHSHPELLHIFAAGNDGNKSCTPYPHGFGTVLGGYQPSKNTLSVANMGKGFNWFHPTSSKGPVKDGRLKPEIAAIGRLVVSGGLDNSYITNTGTSMACPNVTGAAALLTEAYRNKNLGQNPENALLKIALMNGSSDLYHHGPDYKYGYGMLDVQESLEIINNNQYEKFELGQDESFTKSITVPAGVARLKVMVYWNDIPAVPTEDQSISRLMNNLDMVLQIPGGDELNPWTLNPSNPDAPAIRGIDTLNNSEQITLENPIAGAYLISVLGSRILEGEQQAYIAWSFEYNSLTVLNPVGEEKLLNTDSIRVVFKSPETESTFSCFLSTNDGATWSLLHNSIASSEREYTFLPSSSIHSDRCKIVVKENATGKSDTSLSFVISGRLEASLADDSEQCPGSTTITWTGVSYADAYVLFREINGLMQAVDTVDAAVNDYTFTGLDISKKQWFAVAARIGSTTSIRSLALARLPNSGSCLHPENPINDLAVLSINSPQNGRIFTSSSLGTDEKVQVTIRNQGKTLLSNVQLAYQIDEATPIAEEFSLNLAPGSDTTISFTLGIEGLESPAAHHLTVYHISTTSSELRHNDTLIHQFAQLANEPISYLEGIVDNFETLSNQSYTHAMIGLVGSDRWDFEKTSGYGRLKTFVNSDVCINGTRAITMDLQKNASPSFDSVSTNALIGTFNLSEIDFGAREMRFDFLYRFAGRPKYQEGNSLYLRGSDTDPWIFVMHLDTASAGSLKYAGAFSLNDILSAADQTFTSSTQIKITQRDTSLIAGLDFGNALTVDSLRLYPVSNDVSLEAIRVPRDASCTLDNTEQVTLSVRNNVYYPLENVSVSYQVGAGPIRTEIIAEIPAKTTIDYTFASTEDFSEKGMYTINAWVNAIDDSYRANDSLLNETILHLAIIDEFPYLESFDAASEQFFTHDSSAFVLATPYSAGIFTAANGTLCWSTSNIRSDSSKAKSYLYSPCFDISSLDQPYISFSFSGTFPMQDSSIALASAWVEYSTDDEEWTKLGDENTGFNWYNHNAGYWAHGLNHWQVVTHKLPVISSTIKFRWVFESFSGSKTSNFAIDDVHIYDAPAQDVWDERGTFTEEISIASGVASKIENDLYHYVWLDESTKNGTYLFNMYNHATPVVAPSNEAIIPTSFSIGGANNSTVQARFFVPHSSIELLKELDCPCQKVHQIYGNGISIYHSDNPQEINGSLDDNQSGNYSFIKPEAIRYIPYKNGYMVETMIDIPGEIWFSSGGTTGEENIGFIPVELIGRPTNNILAWLQWVSQVDNLIVDFYLERMDESGAFLTIAHREKNVDNEGVYEYVDQPQIIDNKATYRIRYIDTSGTTRLTQAVTLVWSDDHAFSIFPNPINESTLNIGYRLPNAEPINIRMFDISGKSIFTKEIRPNTNQGILTLQLGSFGISAGTYVLDIRSGTHTFSEKIIFIK